MINLTDSLRDVSRRLVEIETDPPYEPCSPGGTAGYLMNCRYELCFQSMRLLGFERAMQVCVAVLEEYWQSFHLVYPKSKSYRRALNRLKRAIADGREIEFHDLRRFGHHGADLFASAIESAFDAVRNRADGKPWIEETAGCIGWTVKGWRFDEWLRTVFGRPDIRIDRTRKGDPAHEMSGYEKTFGCVLSSAAIIAECKKWLEVADLIEKYQDNPLLFNWELITERATARQEGRLY